MYAIHATDRVHVFYEAGARDTAVFSFSGIGLGLNVIQKQEFGHSLRDDDATQQVFFILDRGRTWYNASAPEILGVLQPAAAHFPRVTTLGNSMGGFGAIHFASAFPNCRRAIAFCPQFSVAPGTMPPIDTRWPAYRAAIAQPHVLAHALTAPSADVEYVLFFGADDAADMAHAALFRATPGVNLALHCLADCGHDVAASLRDRDALQPLLSHLISDAGPTAEVPALLAGFGIRLAG